MTAEVMMGLLIPFAGTSLGAAMVFFFLKADFRQRTEDSYRIRGGCHGRRILLESAAALA